jgi:hypothetical protein
MKKITMPKWDRCGGAVKKTKETKGLNYAR